MYTNTLLETEISLRCTYPQGIKKTDREMERVNYKAGLDNVLSYFSLKKRVRIAADCYELL